MTIHVKVWSGAGNGCITDMTNAHKRGKKCRVARLHGFRVSAVVLDMLSATPEQVEARKGKTSYVLECNPVDAIKETDFDAILDVLRTLHATDIESKNWDITLEEIRAIDAPRPKLTAGVTGVWGGEADETGISLSAHNDPYNEWTEISLGQSKARAYEIAVKVWPEVMKAKTVHEAGDILRKAGASLHGYCAID